MLLDRSHRQHSNRILLGILLIALVVLILWELWLKNNIHTVISSQVYRSAELSPAKLDQLVQQRGIKTVLNLEGTRPNAIWYQGEVAICKRYHIAHYNMSLNAHHLPTAVQLKRLTHILETAPRPILIHCHRGADRTGLAAAIAIILSGNPSLADAEQQYSWQYEVISPTSVGKLVIPRYQHWLQHHHLLNTKQDFLLWLNIYPKSKLSPLPQG